MQRCRASSTSPRVASANNTAEHDLCMVRGCMKLSGGLASARRVQDFATLRSLLSTVRKQTRNRVEALLHGSAVLLAGLRC